MVEDLRINSKEIYNFVVDAMHIPHTRESRLYGLAHRLGLAKSLEFKAVKDTHSPPERVKALTDLIKTETGDDLEETECVSRFPKNDGRRQPIEWLYASNNIKEHAMASYLASLPTDHNKSGPKTRSVFYKTADPKYER